MTPLQIVTMVLAILLICDTCYSFYYDYWLYGWPVYFSWICDVANFACAIIIMYGIQRRLIMWFKVAAFYLIASDIVGLVVIIVYGSYGFINVPKIISLFIITPLIVILFFLGRQMAAMGDVATPVVAAPVQYQQPAYQAMPAYQGTAQPVYGSGY